MAVKKTARSIYADAYGEITHDYEIHHIDGNRRNNNLENLKLVTPEEHFAIHVRQGDYDSALGFCGKIRIPEYIIMWMKSRHKKKYLYIECKRTIHPFYKGDEPIPQQIDEWLNRIQMEKAFLLRCKGIK